MTDSNAKKPRRAYKKPALKRYGGLVELTRMAVGNMGMADGGMMAGMLRTGI